MILSYNVTHKAQDSSNDDSIKEEELNEIETILKQKQETTKDKPNFLQSGDWSNDVSLGDSGQISKIEFKNMSINSSMKDYLSHAEDYIQKDVMHFIDADTSRKDKTGTNISLTFLKQNESVEGKIFDVSNDISISSQKSKNYILKSTIHNQDTSSKIMAPNFNMNFNTNSIALNNNNPNNITNLTNKDANTSHNTSSFIKFNNGCINYNNNQDKEPNESVNESNTPLNPLNALNNMTNILNINPQDNSKDILNPSLLNVSTSNLSTKQNTTGIAIHVNSPETAPKQQTPNYLNPQLNINISNNNSTNTNKVPVNNPNILLVNPPTYNKSGSSIQQSISGNNSLNKTGGVINTSGASNNQIDNSTGNKTGNSNIFENANSNNNSNLTNPNPNVMLQSNNITRDFSTTSVPTNNNNPAGLVLNPNLCLSPPKDILLPPQTQQQQQPNTNSNEFAMKDLLSKIDMLSLQQQNQLQPNNQTPLKQNTFSPLEMQVPNSSHPISTPSTSSSMYSQVKQTFSAFPYDLSQISSQSGNMNTLGNDIIENCITVCKEQAGCRILQKKIDENPQLAIDIIYPKIRDRIKELSNDQFGNYFVQKIIEYITDDQLEDLLKNKIATIFRELSLNQHGTRVIQKIFEKIINNERLLSFFTLILTPNLKDFIIDANATHIIIKYVSLIQSPGNDFIIEFLAKNIYEIATQKHSCCSLQKCIEFSNVQQKHYLLLAVANNSYGLFMDQYGNYVVQFVVSACNYEINKIIVINFLRDFQKFSSQKYSSNVIEKSLDCCDEETKQMIVEKLCDQKLVSCLLFDMYGNYVLQKTMSLAKEPYRTRFIQMVGPYLENLKVLTFGQKLYNKLLVTFPELTVYAKTDMLSSPNNSYKRRNKKQKTPQVNTPNQNNAIGLQGINPQMNMFMQQNPNMMMNQNSQNNNMKSNNMNNNPYNNYNNNMFYQNQFYNNNPYPSNNYMNVPPQNQMKNQNNVFNMQNNFPGNGMPSQNFMQQNSFMPQNTNDPSLYYNQANQNMQGGNFMHNYYN